MVTSISGVSGSAIGDYAININQIYFQQHNFVPANYRMYKLTLLSLLVRFLSSADNLCKQVGPSSLIDILAQTVLNSDSAAYIWYILVLSLL